MKKKVIAIALVTAFAGMGVAQAADVTAQAVATWSATAKKTLPANWLLPRLAAWLSSMPKGLKALTHKKVCLMLRLKAIPRRLPSN